MKQKTLPGKIKGCIKYSDFAVVEVQEIGRNYLLSTEAGLKISVKVTKNGITIKTKQGSKSFRFIDSKPEMVRAIGELLVVASQQ